MNKFKPLIHAQVSRSLFFDRTTQETCYHLFSLQVRRSNTEDLAGLHLVLPCISIMLTSVWLSDWIQKLNPPAISND